MFMFGIDDQATRDFLKAHDDFTYKNNYALNETVYSFLHK